MKSQREFDSHLEKKVAETYLAEGYTVVVHPQKDDLPFDLGDYVPDMLVYRLGGVKYLIEVKGYTTSIAVERFREIADTVSSQPGWRFLLVTAENPLPNLDEGNANNPLTWQQIRRRFDQAKRMESLGEQEAAFLILWGTLEAILRNRAEETNLPLERVGSLALVNHLYSQGELSMEQFDGITSLSPTRNSLAHGFQTPNIETAVADLRELTGELIDRWHPSYLDFVSY